jgi:hypothetical protein
MVGTIAPLVQEVEAQDPRTGRFRVLAGHLLATLAGGLTLGLVIRTFRLGLEAVVPSLTQALVEWGPVLLAGVALYLVVAATTLRLPLPMVNRQVPVAWRTSMGPERASLAYGFVLGTGVLTRINSPAFYLIPVVLMTSPSLAGALAPAAAFALARGGIVTARSLVLQQEQFTDPEGLARKAAAQRHMLLTMQLMCLAGVVVAASWASGVLVR